MWPHKVLVCVVGVARKMLDLARCRRDRLVRDAVGGLPQKYRDALTLFYFHEMDVGRAASSLGVPEGTLSMASDELDRALADEPDILPSSGFVNEVMERVRLDREAPPLEFPWRRAWPLGALLAGVLMWLVIARLSSDNSAATDAITFSASRTLLASRWAQIYLAIVAAVGATVLPLRWSRMAD